MMTIPVPVVFLLVVLVAAEALCIVWHRHKRREWAEALHAIFRETSDLAGHLAREESRFIRRLDFTRIRGMIAKLVRDVDRDVP